MMSLSVVIPVYNAGENLVPLYHRLIPVLEGLSDRFEILLVDDGSRDQSWERIESLSAGDPRLRGIRLSRNFGQHNALLCAIRAAQHEVIITMDDDLQNPPEEIPRLLAKLAEGFDVVYGYPREEHHGLFRNLASSLTKLVLQRAMGVETARHCGAFRAIRSSVCEAFIHYRASFISLDVLLTWGTSSFAAIPVDHHPREHGQSNYTLMKLLGHATNMLTGFTTVPLRLASLTGFLFTVFGLGILSYVVIRYLIQGSVVPGFPFLASIIAIFAGAQLFALGIIGEYLARMHSRSIEKPSYVIKASTGGPCPRPEGPLAL